MRWLSLAGYLTVVGGMVLTARGEARARDGGWITLSAEREFAAWRSPRDGWIEVGGVHLDSHNARRLAMVSGQGVLVNGRTGSAHNLVSKKEFRDVEVHVEFLIPQGSNSGVKLEGLYEIQIFDSDGVKKLSGSDCGGIYPRAEQAPQYHHIDEGVPPRVNAARRAGEWQTLDITFRAPRFDAQGKKTAHARFVKVVLNGQVVQEEVEVRTPTGHAWHEREVAAGPLLLQADHGPVAFRNIRVRPQES